MCKEFLPSHNVLFCLALRTFRAIRNAGVLIHPSFYVKLFLRHL
jgi:hypothetical protein